MTIIVCPVIFQIVTCKMFNRSTSSRVRLNALGLSSCTNTGNKRIFRIIFEVSSTQRISLDIHSRCQPKHDSKFFHFGTDNISCFVKSLFIPGLCQQSCCRNSSAILIISNFLLFQRPIILFHKNIHKIISKGWFLPDHILTVIHCKDW